MRILLTGATGFVGRNIKPVLEQKYDVIGVGSEYDLRYPFHTNEMLAFNDADVVVHAAGTVGGIQANKDNPGKFIYDNLSMGMNLIEACRVFRIKKFILLGTVCSYPKYCQTPFREEDLWSGYPEETNAPYGIAKRTLMQMVMSYKKQYGFNGVNLIPVNMYGPHDHFNLTSSHVIPALILKFYNAVKNNEKEVVVWGTGRATREFLYASDLADAIDAAIQRDVPSSPINIGTGREITIADLVTEIANQMGYTGSIKFDSSKPDGQPRRRLNTAFAEELLNFKANTNLNDGLQTTIEWFKKNADTII